MEVRKWLWLATLTLLTSVAGLGQTTVLGPCGAGGTAWSGSSGICGVSIPGGGGLAFQATGPTGAGVISGGVVDLVPSSSNHVGNALNFGTKVSTGPFFDEFQFLPNGWTYAFIFQNNTNTQASGGLGTGFGAGAGCEGAFYQGFSTNNLSTNDIFAVSLSSYDAIPISGSPRFTYSTVGQYQAQVSPCNPNLGGGVPYIGQTRISTSPVPLTSPANSENSTTGDTYDVKINYTGTFVVLNMFDVTAGGSCPGVTCFEQVWPANVASQVGATTAWIGITSATGSSPTVAVPMTVNTWVHKTLPAASNPTFSGSTSIALASSGGVICYNTTGAPATDGISGCINGTLYSGAITVSSSETIYAVGGGTNFADSTVTSNAYTIGSTAAAPTFFPAGGATTFNGYASAYWGKQTVTLSTAIGTGICYSTSTTPVPNGSGGCSTGTLYSAPLSVSSTETINAISFGAGLTNSAVNSTTYTINPDATTPPDTPTMSPVPGSYPGTQSVTLSSSAGSNICYSVGTSPPSVPPFPDNNGGCAAGTVYSGAITVSSSKSVYAIAGLTGVSPASSPTVGAFTINAVTGGPVTSGKSAFKGKVTVQ